MFSGHVGWGEKAVHWHDGEGQGKVWEGNAAVQGEFEAERGRRHPQGKEAEEKEGPQRSQEAAVSYWK